MLATIARISERLRAYEAANLIGDIYERDNMFMRGIPGATEHYFSVGRSAIDIIVKAMISANRTEFKSILDLPSGAGRVTRHLRAFFPESDLFVGEIDTACRRFAASAFDAIEFPTAPHFDKPFARAFDMIFVGSLFTHLNADQFARAMQCFVQALYPSGLLIMTTHGRTHDVIERTQHRAIDHALWDRVSRDRAACGFGYVETEILGGLSYGVSWSAPSWLLGLVENDPTVRIIGFQEAAWDNHQDTLVLQKV